jgi:hypothetical protein
MEAINQTDIFKPNTYSQEQKIRWLSQIDQKIRLNILDTHDNGPEESFIGYTTETDQDTELLVAAPFDVLYLRWLEAQIDYHNGEIKRYNISIGMFNTEYEAFENYYRRNHMPKSKGRFVF